MLPPFNQPYKTNNALSHGLVTQYTPLQAITTPNRRRKPTMQSAPAAQVLLPPVTPHHLVAADRLTSPPHNICLRMQAGMAPSSSATISTKRTRKAGATDHPAAPASQVGPGQRISFQPPACHLAHALTSSSPSRRYQPRGPAASARLPPTCERADSQRATPVYKFTCAPTGRTYIGVSTRPHQRYQAHMRLNTHAGSAIWKDLNKYKPAAFTLHILQSGLTEAQALQLEESFIKQAPTPPELYRLCERAGRQGASESGPSSGPTS